MNICVRAVCVTERVYYLRVTFDLLLFIPYHILTEEQMANISSLKITKASREDEYRTFVRKDLAETLDH